MPQTKTNNGSPRIDFNQPVVSEILKAMQGLETSLQNSGLEPALRELVKIRGSQLNGCAFCIDMHTKDARAHGESEQRIYALSAWQQTPFFTDRERAALEWTEHLTLIAGHEVPDDLYARVRAQFSEEETAKLTLAVVQINGWNRLVKSFRPVVGSYQPPKHEKENASAALVPDTLVASATGCQVLWQPLPADRLRSEAPWLL